MTIVASNSITVSNVNDGTITHTAYAYSADGTDRFTIVYPNLNLLDGTKDFSGTWTNSSSWVTDGTYKGLTVKKRTAQWNGIYETFTAPKDGDYTFSAYVKSSGNTANVYRYGGLNITSGSQKELQKSLGNNFDWIRDTVTVNLKANDNIWFKYEITGSGTDSILWTAGHKWESGSTATPYMQSSTEVTTADWPSYIGQYSDFTSTASTDPAKYAPWTLFKGKDGATGPQGPQGLKGDPGATGIPGQAGADGKTSYLHIAYATNSTGTAGFDVSNATGKTYIGQYTDFTSADSTDPSKYKWSLIKGDKGDKGDQGLQGPAGSNGDPGKIVSDTEPTTKFKGLTWKYSGSADMTASDGTAILSGTEYYWSGTNWILSELNAHNINVDDLSAISTTLTNGKFISNWSSDTATGTTTIEKNHLIINSANASLNTKNTIALDNEQGMMMTYTNTINKRMISAGVNFQGLFVTDSTGPYVSVTPTGIVNSVDVPWTSIGTYADYKRDGNVVTIRVVDAITTTAGNITLGRIPSKDGPVQAVMGPAIAWSSDNANDKHLQINAASGGATVTILNAVANQKYKFQFSYQI